ncbi:MAG: hypothetical protein ACYSSL_07780 [Planctomycetota bacterium]|jgi:hypothetical protein
MNHKTIFLILLLILFPASLVFALDPIGPPVAELNEAQVSAGIEYSYSRLDLEGDSIPSFGIGSFKLSDDNMNKVYGRLALGYNKNWELFLRAGGVEEDYIDDHSFDFAIGGGTKITVYDQGDLEWGVVGQFIYYEKDSDTVSATTPLGDLFVGDAEANIYEIQIATGPKLKLASNISAYGGALWYIVDGDVDIDGTLDGSPGKWNTDIEEDSAFGGYVGVQVDLDKKTDWNVEYQCVSGGFGLGTQIVWRF